MTTPPNAPDHGCSCGRPDCQYDKAWGNPLRETRPTTDDKTNAPEVDVLAVLREMKINASLYRTTVQGDDYKPSEISWLMERDENAISAVAALLTREAALVAERDARDACLQMICQELQNIAPWPKSDGKEDEEEIMCGLGLLAQDRDALAAEVGELRDAISAVKRAAMHNFVGCEPSPFKRMPPELKFAISSAVKRAEAGHG